MINYRRRRVMKKIKKKMSCGDVVCRRFQGVADETVRLLVDDDGLKKIVHKIKFSFTTTHARTHKNTALSLAQPFKQTPVFLFF